MKGLDMNDTHDLTSIVKTDNDNFCDDQFWSEPNDNGDERIGLLEKTSQKVK